MNKVFVSGIIVAAPIVKKETEAMPHLVFSLGTRHKTRAGKIKYEKYTINAWNHIAIWGASRLEAGQTLTVQGYLTQRVIKMDDLSFVMTEITAEKFILNAYASAPKANAEASPVYDSQDEIGTGCISDSAIAETADVEGVEA